MSVRYLLTLLEPTTQARDRVKTEGIRLTDHSGFEDTHRLTRRVVLLDPLSNASVESIQ